MAFISSSPTTASAALKGSPPGQQGHTLRVDLSLSENPYLACAADFIPNPNAPEAAPGYDGDGFTNEHERLANFSRAANGETFSLTWARVPGKTYRIETSQSLLSPDWTALGSPVTATATTPALTVPLAPTDERRF